MGGDEAQRHLKVRTEVDVHGLGRLLKASRPNQSCAPMGGGPQRAWVWSWFDPEDTEIRRSQERFPTETDLQPTRLLQLGSYH